MRAVWISVMVMMSCGGDQGDDDATDPTGCDFPCQYSTANSGGLCQANAYCDVEFSVYCGEEEDGSYSCDCGPAAESPPSFSSDDFCDLDGEARLCEALERCSNWAP